MADNLSEKIGWSFLEKEPKLIILKNIGLPDKFCGICHYNFKNNFDYFRNDCPQCESFKLK